MNDVSKTKFTLTVVVEVEADDIAAAVRGVETQLVSTTEGYYANAGVGEYRIFSRCVTRASVQ